MQSVHPIGGEVTFPAPWEADFDASGEAAVDILPPTSAAWQGSQAVANVGDVGLSLGCLRASISPQAATAQEGLPDLVLGWRGVGGGAALAHLHLLVRVLLPENVADACSRARGDDRQANEQLVSQASFSLGPLLAAAAELQRRRASSEREGAALGEEGSSASETEDLGQDGEDLVVSASEPLIRHGMPEYIGVPGNRQLLQLRFDLRVKVIDPMELENRKRLTRYRMMEAEGRKTKHKHSPRRRSKERCSAATFSATKTLSQEQGESSRGGGWFSHHRTMR